MTDALPASASVSAPARASASASESESAPVPMSIVAETEAKADAEEDEDEDDDGDDSSGDSDDDDGDGDHIKHTVSKGSTLIGSNSEAKKIALYGGGGRVVSDDDDEDDDKPLVETLNINVGDVKLERHHIRRAVSAPSVEKGSADDADASRRIHRLARLLPVNGSEDSQEGASRHERARTWPDERSGRDGGRTVETAGQHYAETNNNRRTLH
jgi:hypothetical protein